jgi:hypothetical protein
MTKKVFLSYVERAEREGKTLRDAVAEFDSNFGDGDMCWIWLGLKVEDRDAQDPQ